MALSTIVSWLPLPTVLLLLFPLLLLAYKNKTRSHYSKLPPGPTGLPILGNLHQLGDFPHQSLWSFSKKHGSLMHLQLGNVPTLVVSSATAAREVMKTHDLEFCSRPALTPYRKLSYNLSDVAFAPYGPYWREMRKICVLELFSSKRVQSFAFIRKEEIGNMIQSISESSSSPLNPVNLSVIIQTYTSNVVCRSGFGKSYEGTLPGALDRARASLGSFFFADFVPWTWWIDVLTGNQEKLEKNFMELDAFYDRVIDEHLSRGPESEEEDLVHVLLRVQKELKLTRDHVKGILMDILIAGTDTTTAAIVWAMAELIKHPATMKKVQEEVRTIGRKSMVEESDINQLQYLNSVIKETLRLHPPGPLLTPRETMKECSIDGYEIPAKTMVIVNATAVGRDPDSWKNPEDFSPERFAKSSIDFKGQDFELIPFGAGRRGCPGMYFGSLTMGLGLANLLYSFNWELPAGMNTEDLDMNDAPGITVNKKTDMHLVPNKYV